MNTAKSLLAALVTIVSVGINFVHGAPEFTAARHHTLPVSSYHVTERPTAPTEPTIVLPEMRITSTKATSVSQHKTSKRWVCKAPRHLEQGPVTMTVKECDWQ